MRYLDGKAPGSETGFSAGMHDMLTLTMSLGVIIGILLLLLGLKGRIMWLKFWSAGLIAASLLYLLNDYAMWF